MQGFRSERLSVILLLMVAMSAFLVFACTSDDDDDDTAATPTPTTNAATPTPTSPPSGSQIGDTATDFTLLDRYGVAHSMSQYRGNVILLDLSAMWCGPCQAEAANAEALYQQYRERGFIILSVLIADYDNNLPDAEDLATWADKYGLTFPVLADSARVAWDIYNDEDYIPLNLVIDKDFVIRYKDVGYDEAGIVSVIEQYL